MPANKKDGQDAVDDLAAKSGMTDSITPTFLATDTIQRVFDASNVTNWSRVTGNYTVTETNDMVVSIPVSDNTVISLPDPAVVGNEIRVDVYNQTTSGFTVKVNDEVAALLIDILPDKAYSFFFKSATMDWEIVQLAGKVVPGDLIDQGFVMGGASVSASQEPSGTDAPMQIEYGPAVNGPTDPVEMDANGTITFNEVGSYGVALYYQFGRSGASGTSEIVFRSMIDIGGVGSYVQAGDSVATFIANSNSLQVIQLFIPFAVSVANTKLRQEIIRDSNGNDSGGIFQYNPTLAGVGDAPSASIFIFRDTVE
jgi:hypothetical protein